MSTHYVSTGEPFIVDDEFDEMIRESSWQLLRGRAHATTYVRANCYFPGTKGNRLPVKSMLLHRVLMGALPSEHIDHVNGNGMDNRLCNLRIATHQENQWNRQVRQDTTSGYKGVTLTTDSPVRPWLARLNHNGVRHKLGYHKTKEEAALAYNAKAKELHGEFARLNVVPQEDIT